MSNIHTITDWVGVSPQAACAQAMREKRPFVIGLGIEVAVGDLLMIPDYFVSYPVLRFAEPSEIRKKLDFAVVAVVCQEPPEETTEKAHTEVGDGDFVRGVTKGSVTSNDKWGYGR